jgi:hypothetical protein
LHVVTRISAGSLSDLIRSLHPIDAGPKLIRIGPDGDGGYLVPDDLRNDRATQREYVHDFPHPRDRDNAPKQTLVLPDCWHR